jgi:hypothetical protein
VGIFWFDSRRDRDVKQRQFKKKAADQNLERSFTAADVGGFDYQSGWTFQLQSGLKVVGKFTQKLSIDWSSIKANERAAFEQTDGCSPDPVGYY